LTGLISSIILTIDRYQEDLMVMEPATVGELVQKKRMEKGLTQEDLAARCRLDTRTVQRVEKGEVKPYFSTLKALSGVLEFDFVAEMNAKPWDFSPDDIRAYREIFAKRRTIRIVLMIIALAAMLAVAASFPSFRIFGLAKRAWVPFFYLLMFGIIIAIGLVWKCPACGASLGSPFNTRLCPRCGFRFKAD
jgi:transcriptional regulator with XRE-family HTH domain